MSFKLCFLCPSPIFLPSKQNLPLSSLYHVVGEYYGIKCSDFSTSLDNKRTVFVVLYLYMVHIEYHDLKF